VARLSRASVAGLVTAAIVAAGCTLPAVAPRAGGSDRGAAPQPDTTAAPAWTPCPEIPEQLFGRGARGMTYECTTVTVPRDWTASAAPGGETFEIALLRIRSDNQRDRIGSLVVNPGGPGVSGIDTAVYLSFGSAFAGLPAGVTDRFDIVGFDPRGVGRSSPIECISDADTDAVYGSDPDPDSQPEFNAAVALTDRVGDACGDKYGEQLRLYSTEQASRDIDAVRAAVGDAKLTYLGYSYGTLLGATYAQLFPQNVRALVLDGAVDPRQDFVAGSESQAQGFERAFGNFAAWCAQNGSRCPIGPDARAAVTAAIEKARVSPAKGSGGRVATSGWVFYAVISSLYNESGWERLATAIDQIERGNPTGVFKLADAYAERDQDGHYSNFSDAFPAVNCADQEERVTVQQVRDLQGQWRKKYPMFGASLALDMLKCANWPAPRDPYPTGPANGAPPILVVGTTGDPATPYEQTAKLADMLGVGRVLTWEGEGHTAYPQTHCISEAVDRYLIDLIVPPEGKRCPAR
jgi:pimeloyl-ACP methyl ester carboxylesterase